MKRSFFPLICLLFLCNIPVIAQKDRIINLQNFDKQQFHFGYYLGMNKKGFKVSYELPNSLVEVESKIGFNIGLVLDFRLHNNINLRFEPGLSSNNKVLTFNNPTIPDTEKDRIRKVPGTYLRLPLLVKLRTNRLDNFAAFVIGGASYDFNFSSNEKNKDDNFEGEFRMKRSNFMYEVGLGVDIYLPYFKFSPSIRGIFAINNELVPDNNPASPWTLPIDYFGTRGVFLNLTFE